MSTFLRLPTRENFERWRNMLPFRAEYSQESGILRFIFKPEINSKEIKGYLIKYEISQKKGAKTKYISPIYLEPEIRGNCVTMNAKALGIEKCDRAQVVILDLPFWCLRCEDIVRIAV